MDEGEREAKRRMCVGKDCVAEDSTQSRRWVCMLVKELEKAERWLRKGVEGGETRRPGHSVL